MQSQHEGVKFLCDICEKQYTSQDSLKRHQKEVHEDIKYSCGQCEKQYTKKTNLKRHQTVHKDIKYSCDKCDYQANREDRLKDHIKTDHEGVTYHCNICNKHFRQVHGLNRHKLIHEGLKIFL